MRRLAKYGWILLPLIVVGVAIWLASRPPIEKGPISFRYAGVTNYAGRTYALFRIGNHTASTVRGYTFTIMRGSDGWIAPRAHASNVTYKDQRQIWLAPTQAPPNDIALVAALPPSDAVWRLVLKAPGLGPSKPGWRVQTAGFLIQRQYFRLGRWIMPRPKKSETLPDDLGHGGCVLGPEMRGAKPK